MNKVILFLSVFIFGVKLLVSPALAQVDQCTAPPNLQNPKSCTISSNGGSCSFGSNEDGIVEFPDQIVTGTVSINGGRNVYIQGGHIGLSSSSRGSLDINSPNNVFIEGMHVDANGYCDVFAIRSPPDGVVATVTFQNIYAEGPKYNVVDGDCHGDLIQNQGGKSNRGLNLRVENFVGVTGAQGFFIPYYSDLGMTAELRNVYIRPTSGNTKPLLWFSSDNTSTPPYPVTLDNVWVDWSGDWQFYPNSRILSADGEQISWPAEEKITGVVQKGFDVDEAAFKANVGLNYNRSNLCSPTEPDPTAETDPTTEPDPTAEADPVPDPEPDPASSLNIANATTMVDNSRNFDPANPVEGLWDGCLDGSTVCSPGNGAQTSFWVEYDLGQLYDLTQTRLFGDATGGWVSKTWSLEYKENIDDPWIAAFSDVDVFYNSWIAKDLTAQAQFIKVTVLGDAAVQAREFELFGTIAEAQTAEPDPAPEPEPDPVAEVDPVPDPEPDSDPNLNIANATTISDNSGNFDPANPVDGMWDGCLDGSTACSPGSGVHSEFWVEYDLGQLHDLTQTRLFGDAAGNWVSKSWTVQYKKEQNDPWVAVVSNLDALSNSWISRDLNVQARYVKTTVRSDAAVQAREFELFGTVAQSQTTEPDPAPEPEPDPTAEAEPEPEPSPEQSQDDNVPPSVQIAAPSNGGSVKRNSRAVITIDAIDNVAVSDVELRISGRRVAKFSGEGPYSFEWKVTPRFRGDVTISAQATDTSGNYDSTTVSVNVIK